MLPATDPQAKSTQRKAQFFQICALSLLSSLLISLWTVILSQSLAPTASQHDLDQAAIMLANELGKLSVRNGRFGNVGIIDIQDGARSQMGLNRLQATLRLDGMIANQLGYNGMAALVSKDVNDVNKLTRNFARMERELANPESSRFGRNSSFVDLVRRVLAQTGAGGRLRSLKITLGGLRQSKFSSKTSLPAIPAERGSAYADGNNYRAHVDVPVFQDKIYQFYELADSPTLITPLLSQFTEIPDDAVASVIHLEADFEVAESGRLQRIQKMHSCALVGAPPVKRPGSVFMLSFPQGYFSGITCLNDLLLPKAYEENKRGDWYQALAGDVPGEGTMVGAQKDSPAMPPYQAAMQLLYHFIFEAGTTVVPTNLEMLMAEPIGLLQVPDSKAAGESLYNSGLFKDTGAASFALRRQSAGHMVARLLTSAFSSQSIEKMMPGYAFPLVVDSSGELNLPEENGFDEQRTKDFFVALWKTNIAALESMHTGATAEKRMQMLADESNKKMDLIREELRSVNQSIGLLRGKSGDREREKKLTTLQEQAEELGRSLKDEKASQLHSLRIKARAAVVVQNGKDAAKNTYEIGMHMSSFTARGLKLVTAPNPGYLMSRRYVFIPHTMPVDEDDVYSLDEGEPRNRGAKQVATANWTSEQFRITCLPQPSMEVDDSPINLYLRTVPQPHSIKPFFVMLSSVELASKRNPSLFASTQTPFENGAIKNSELCYFAPQCIITGGQHKVSWSVMARDLVYSMVEGAGRPLLSAKPHWCQDLGMEEESCPGLATEFQIRTPIPAENPAIPAYYLQDPDGGPSVALYPPLPIDLL